MRKVLPAIFAVILIIAGITACGGNDGKEKSGELSGRISLDGSSSMEKVAGFLSEAFAEEHTGVRISYNPTGSSAGIQAVAEERCDIGLASRPLREEEKRKGLQQAVAAVDGIVVIVHPDNPVKNLSLEQIGEIYKGEIKNWKELGGKSLPIVMIGREAGSGTREGFEEITGTKGICKYNQELTSTGDVIQTVAGNPNALGYASWASVKDRVKVLKVDGVAASRENIQDGKYKLRRDFYLVTKSEKKLSEEAQAFFEFAVSGAADDLIESAGAVPVKR